MPENKAIIGLTEWVMIKGADKEHKVLARIDTGATKSSVDSRLAAELQLGPIKQTKVVKSAHGTSVRPVIEAEVEIHNIRVTAEFTLADRSHMKYRMLIGTNILKGPFIIDPSKETK